MAQDLEDIATRSTDDWSETDRELSDPEIDAFLAAAQMEVAYHGCSPDPTPFAPDGYDEWGRRNSGAGTKN